MADLHKIVSCLEQVKSNGTDKWLACCPAHDDRSPSLAIKQVDDKILLHCFAGCSMAEIVGSIGLELSYLMPDRPPYHKGSTTPKFNKYELFDKVVYEGGILCVTIQQLINCVSLSADDLKRIKLAVDTIDNILREVRS